jgi:NADH:ubiquinone oxidoreductase subunit E
MMPALKMAFSGPRPRGTATVKICVAAACVVVAAERYQSKAATNENERKDEIQA